MAAKHPPRRIAFLLVNLVLIVGLFAFPAIGFADDPADEGLKQLDAMEAAFKRAIERVQPSVVSVYLKKANPGHSGEPQWFRRRNFDRDPLDDAATFGSGIVVAPGGFVLTCYHVIRPAIRETNYEIVVLDSHGQSFKGMLHAADPRSDLAVIRVAVKSPDTLPVAKLGDGKSLTRGQIVLAVGNSFGIAGDGNISASWGIISNLKRKPARVTGPITDEVDEEEKRWYRLGTLVQTDVRLNGGTSGGALINTRGDVVGITVPMTAAVGFETPGGFAIPVDDVARRVINTLVEGKEVEYGYLGLVPFPVSAEEALGRGHPAIAGIIVENMPVPGLPASLAGLQHQDLIVSLNGKPVRSTSDLMTFVGGQPAGATINMEVLRKQQPEPIKLKVTLAKYPVRGEIYVTYKRPIWQGMRVDFLSTLRELEFTAPRGEREDLEQGGVVIEEVQTQSPAEAKGLRPKDVIVRVNGEPVTNPAEFERLVNSGKRPIRLLSSKGVEYTFLGEKDGRPAGVR